MTMDSEHTAGLTALDQGALADLTLDVQGSRRALARLLRTHRALRRRLRQAAGPGRLIQAGASPPPAGTQIHYWVERGVHTRHGTFTAVLTPVPGGPGSRDYQAPLPVRASRSPTAPPITSGPLPAHGPAIKVETALDCWWAWRHPNMTATIAARRGSVLWLDFHYPETGARSDPFPAYRARYAQARQQFVPTSITKGASDEAY